MLKAPFLESVEMTKIDVSQTEQQDHWFHRFSTTKVVTLKAIIEWVSACLHLKSPTPSDHHHPDYLVYPYLDPNPFGRIITSSFRFQSISNWCANNRIMSSAVLYSSVRSQESIRPFLSRYSEIVFSSILWGQLNRSTPLQAASGEPKSTPADTPTHPTAGD